MTPACCCASQTARGVLWCSQIAAGEENGLNIRVYGTKAGLEWHQEHPNWLYFKDPAGPMQVYKRGNGYLGEAAAHNSHLPSGHPEAFFEAFGNLYMNITNTIRARLAGDEPTTLDLDFPTVHDGRAASSSLKRWWKAAAARRNGCPLRNAGQDRPVQR